MKAVDVLENIRLPIGDEYDVEFIEGLVYEAHIVLLDGGMLRSRVCKLGERGKKGFDSRSIDLAKLS